MDIGKRITQLRGKISREEFVEGLGIHAQTLYMYEKGKRQPDLGTLRNICDKYHVSADWLIFGDNEQQEQPPALGDAAECASCDDLRYISRELVKQWGIACERLHEASERERELRKEIGALNMENALLESQVEDLQHQLSLSVHKDDERTQQKTA
ncbi:MAG: helix-turn-helix domain-containing protein [Desulfovibrionaceae bacterium]|nr:helix-turn-helix domain-containing protein [Desulfovibrionaceae bacterium]